jgi:predicted nucleic acid-binding protein
MGLILDSSVLISEERKGHTARQALTRISAYTGEERIAVSVITVMEMAHGLVRANTPGRRTIRQQFLTEVMQAIPVRPVTTSIALRAGRIDGENTAVGIRLAISDLLIGVTALEIGYSVLTSNVRHFQMIPGPTVLSV